MRLHPGALAVILVTLAGAEAAAQSGQPFSVQGSLLSTTIYYGKQVVPGIGAEAQFRVSSLYASERGVLSAGVGGQFTSHSSGNDNIDLKGVFVEPRYVFALKSDRWFPYVAGRVALLQQKSNFTTSSSGFAAGGGAGVVYVFSKRVNFDVGGAAIRQSFSDAKYTRVGASQGARYTFTPFMGFALKAGLSYGFGD